MRFDELSADTTNVSNIIDAAVMLSFMLDVENFKHFHHSPWSLFPIHDFHKILFYVDVLFEVFWYFEAFGFGLVSETIV